MFIDSFKQHFESVADPRQSARLPIRFSIFSSAAFVLLSLVLMAGLISVNIYLGITNGSLNSACSKQVFRLTTP